MEKYIVFDREFDAAVTAICDAALKFSGMQMLGHVNKIVASVREREISD